MKIKVVKIGKVLSPYHELASEYIGRVKHFSKIEALTFKNDNDFLEHLQNTKDAKGKILLWDERGKTLSSSDFAGFLGNLLDCGTCKCLTLVVGGPYGLSSEIKKLADFSLSLSNFVLTNEIAWLVSCEQLYRAFTILNKMPYHH